MQGGDVIMVDTVFEDQRGTSAGLLIFAPDPSSLGNIREIAA
jgi:hypothetical protein